MSENYIHILKSGFIAACLLLSFGLNAQDITIKNGSFEGFPQQGRNDQNLRLEGWEDCGKFQFKTASPPDIHQGVDRDTSFWENETRKSHGKTYLGLVVRDNESWESVSQRLSQPLVAGTCYTISVNLARSRTYKSLTSSRDVMANFTEPAVLRIWGGSGLCDCNSQLLAESPQVSNTEWTTFDFKLEPNANYPFITIEAFYETPLFFPYNGHVLVDKMTDITVINCEEEIIVQKEVPKKGPAHKAKKKKKPEVASNVTKIDTIVAKEPVKEKILALDRKKMKTGTKIKIEKLFFEADTSKIGVNSYEVLNEIYDFLAFNSDISIEVGGHTNNTPSHEYCNKLSAQRAKAVASYLIGKGIDDKRISYKGYGKRRPIASNNTIEGRKKNQRVEIKIINIG